MPDVYYQYGTGRLISSSYVGTDAAVSALFYVQLTMLKVILNMFHDKTIVICKVTALVCAFASGQVHATDVAKQRELEPAAIEAGRTLFVKNCAVCHGANGSGPPGDWRKRDADGKLPPPPLNGSAHTWHHSNEQLTEVIRNGSISYGGNMPAWGALLSDTDINHILSYIKSLWPDEVYEIWRQQWGQR